MKKTFHIISVLLMASAMLYSCTREIEPEITPVETPEENVQGKTYTITVNAETGGDFSYHSWQKQERFKGRFGIDFWAGNAGTSDMGWGFSSLGYWEFGTSPMYHPYYVENVLMMDRVRTEQYTIAQAIAVTNDAQLVADPVFRHVFAQGIPSASLTAAERDVLLARGVPALSRPAGSCPFSPTIRGDNQDMNARKNYLIWPRTGYPIFPGWRHNDIKEVAYPYVRLVFEDLLLGIEQ